MYLKISGAFGERRTLPIIALQIAIGLETNEKRWGGRWRWGRGGGVTACCLICNAFIDK